MKKFQNEGTVDRIIRFVLAVIFFALAYYLFSGWLMILFYILAAISFFTSLTGFCALYKLFGISTK